MNTTRVLFFFSLLAFAFAARHKIVEQEEVPKDADGLIDTLKENIIFVKDEWLDAIFDLLTALWDMIFMCFRFWTGLVPFAATMLITILNIFKESTPTILKLADADSGVMNDINAFICKYSGVFVVSSLGLAAFNLILVLLNAVKNYFDEYLVCPEHIPILSWVGVKVNFPFRTWIGKRLDWFRNIKLTFFVAIDGVHAGTEPTIGTLITQCIATLTIGILLSCSADVVKLASDGTCSVDEIKILAFKAGTLVAFNYISRSTV